MSSAIQELTEQARKAIIDGDLDKGRDYTARAKALADLESIKTTPEPVRPPFRSESSVAKETGNEETAKSWYIRKFGKSIDESYGQVARELYGKSYELAAREKWADWRLFAKTGKSYLESMVLLTPEQIAGIVHSDIPVSEAKATMIEAQDTLGGYLVPEEYGERIITRLQGLTVVRKGAVVNRTSRDKVSLPKQTGGNSRNIGATRVTWVDEIPTSTAADTNMTFGNISIDIHTCMATVAVSRNLLEDNAFDLDRYLMNQFASDFALDEDAQFLVGNGVGRPQGILNGTAANGSPFDADITAVASLNASNLTPDGLLAVAYAIAAQYRTGAVWIMAKDTALKIRQMKNGSGEYLWPTKDNQLGSTLTATLAGFPVMESEAMPSVAANKYPIIFGNLEGYSIFDRVGLSVNRYEDSTTSVQNSVKFVARRRVGGKVTDGWKFAVQKVAASL